MKTLILFLVLALAGFGSLFIGAADLTAREVFEALTLRGDPVHQQVVLELRLPRTLLGATIGAGLGASGAALQGYTRNDLAAPGILGFSSWAALGAVLALYFGAANLMTLTALLSSALGVGVILILAGPKKSATTLVLAGVGMGAMATAITGLIMNLAPNPWALSELIYWMMGSLKNAHWDAVLLTGVLTTLGGICLFGIGNDLNVLSLGETTARSLGVSLGRTQMVLVIGVALCVGSGVAAAGTIGFVGLFIPHILRLWMDLEPRALIPYSALGGAAFLVLADLTAKSLSGPGTPLYLGILTSLIGVPFFVWLAIRDSRA